MKFSFLETPWEAYEALKTCHASVSLFKYNPCFKRIKNRFFFLTSANHLTDDTLCLLKFEPQF